MAYPVFEMIKYHGQVYPKNIPLATEEIAAHFDVCGISGELGYSLHTEYSYGKRKFDSPLLDYFPSIKAAQKNDIPQLWKNVEWANQFAEYVITLIADSPAPKVIEIHPPFNDYADIDNFLEAYSLFEEKIITSYPDVIILVENRCGSTYRGGKFVLSKLSDLVELSGKTKDMRLKFALDIPQLFTAHRISAAKANEGCELLSQVKEIRSSIGGVHLWGKRKSASGRLVAHCGDLNDYFENNAQAKNNFLAQFCDTFDDGISRKMVLEVNSSNADMICIIDDLIAHNVNFKQI